MGPFGRVLLACDRPICGLLAGQKLHVMRWKLRFQWLLICDWLAWRFNLSGPFLPLIDHSRSKSKDLKVLKPRT